MNKDEKPSAVPAPEGVGTKNKNITDIKVGSSDAKKAATPKPHRTMSDVVPPKAEAKKTAAVSDVKKLKEPIKVESLAAAPKVEKIESAIKTEKLASAPEAKKLAEAPEVKKITDKPAKAAIELPATMRSQEPATTKAQAPAAEAASEAKDKAQVSEASFDALAAELEAKIATRLQENKLQRDEYDELDKELENSNYSDEISSVFDDLETATLAEAADALDAEVATLSSGADVLDVDTATVTSNAGVADMALVAADDTAARQDDKAEKDKTAAMPVAAAAVTPKPKMAGPRSMDGIVHGAAQAQGGAAAEEDADAAMLAAAIRARYESPRDLKREEQLQRKEEHRKEQAAMGAEGGKLGKMSTKTKAIIVGVAVAIVVALLGWLLASLLSKHEDNRICTVQFEVNGGSAVETQEITCSTMVKRPEDPERDGFEFKDWLYDGMPFDFENTRVIKDMILNAKWVAAEGTETVTVTFDTAGGSAIEPRTVKKGTQTTAPIAPTRDGYTFRAWYKGEAEFDFETVIEEDITLTAHWDEVKKEEKPATPSSPAAPAPVEPAAPETPAEPTNEKVTGISISPLILGKGASVLVNATVTPAGATYNLSATSSNASVVSCSVPSPTVASVRCQAHKGGQVTITVRDTISGVAGTFTVTVNAINSITLSPSGEIALTAGQATTVTATVDGYGSSATWTSSNTAVATVDHGYVVAVAPGTAVITVAAGDKTASVTVTVTAATPPVTPTEPEPGGMPIVAPENDE